MYSVIDPSTEVVEAEGFETEEEAVAYIISRTSLALPVAVGDGDEMPLLLVYQGKVWKAETAAAPPERDNELERLRTRSLRKINRLELELSGLRSLLNAAEEHAARLELGQAAIWRDADDLPGREAHGRRFWTLSLPIAAYRVGVFDFEVGGFCAANEPSAIMDIVGYWTTPLPEMTDGVRLIRWRNQAIRKQREEMEAEEMPQPASQVLPLPFELRPPTAKQPVSAFALPAQSIPALAEGLYQRVQAAWKGSRLMGALIRYDREALYSAAASLRVAVSVGLDDGSEEEIDGQKLPNVSWLKPGVAEKVLGLSLNDWLRLVCYAASVSVRPMQAGDFLNRIFDIP